MTDKKTLEEVAEKLTKDFPHYSVRENMDNSEIKSWFLEALEKGAKHMVERMYSEEEVYELLCDFFDNHVNCQSANISQWFEQFKKK